MGCWTNFKAPINVRFCLIAQNAQFIHQACIFLLAPTILKKISSSSYSVYPAHRKKKLWTGSGEGKTAATHTHKGERGQRSPPARERNENENRNKETDKNGDVPTRKDNYIYTLY